MTRRNQPEAQLQRSQIETVDNIDAALAFLRRLGVLP
jgi:hypothetical protein